VRQVHEKHVQFAPNSTDDPDRFAKIDLRMAWRMRQRNKLLGNTATSLANKILDDRSTAREAVLITQALVDPLGRMPLLARCLHVSLQDCINDGRKSIELRLGRRLLAPISRWNRKGAHLVNGAPAHAEHPSGFALTTTLNQYKLPNRRVNLHGIHPR